MATLHQKLALVIVLLALGGLLWSCYLAWKGRLTPRLRQLGWFTEALLGLQAIAGVVLAAQGSAPRQSLHFIFGPLTLLALPVALLLSRRWDTRGDALAQAAGWVVVFVLCLRATGTGGLSG